MSSSSCPDSSFFFFDGSYLSSFYFPFFFHPSPSPPTRPFQTRVSSRLSPTQTSGLRPDSRWCPRDGLEGREGVTG